MAGLFRDAELGLQAAGRGGADVIGTRRDMHLESEVELRSRRWAQYLKHKEVVGSSQHAALHGRTG